MDLTAIPFCFLKTPARNSRPELPPETPARNSRLWLGEHPIIADDFSTPGLRRLDATLTNSALERLESGQCRQRTAGIGFALDEMHKGIVVEPQRKIAKAFWLCGLQLPKHPGNQLGVFVGHTRLGLIPDQGPFHHALLRSRDANWSPINLLDVRRLQKDSAA